MKEAIIKIIYTGTFKSIDYHTLYDNLNLSLNESNLSLKGNTNVDNALVVYNEIIKIKDGFVPFYELIINLAKTYKISGISTIELKKNKEYIEVLNHPDLKNKSEYILCSQYQRLINWCIEIGIILLRLKNNLTNNKIYDLLEDYNAFLDKLDYQTRKDIKNTIDINGNSYYIKVLNRVFATFLELENFEKSDDYYFLSASKKDLVESKLIKLKKYLYKIIKNINANISLIKLTHYLWNIRKLNDELKLAMLNEEYKLSEEVVNKPIPKPKSKPQVKSALEQEMDDMNLEEYQKELVRSGEYDTWNFEEEELEEEDYFFEDPF